MATSKAASNGLARLIVWVALFFASIGGVATRGTGYSKWVGSVVTRGDTWWLPVAVFVLLVFGLTWSLADASPDLLSMFAVLTIPSVLAPYSEGLVGTWLNWPFEFVYALLSDNVGTIFGAKGSVAGFAGLCWFIAITVGVFALVRYIRSHIKRGGNVPVSGNLADVLAAARKGK